MFRTGSSSSQSSGSSQSKWTSTASSSSTAMRTDTVTPGSASATAAGSVEPLYEVAITETERMLHEHARIQGTEPATDAKGLAEAVAHATGCGQYTALLETAFRPLLHHLIGLGGDDGLSLAEAMGISVAVFCHSDGSAVLQTILEVCAKLEHPDAAQSSSRAEGKDDYNEHDFVSTAQLEYCCRLLNPKMQHVQLQPVVGRILDQLDALTVAEHGSGLHSALVRNDSRDFRADKESTSYKDNDAMFGARTEFHSADTHSVRQLYKCLSSGRGRSEVYPIHLVQGRVRKLMGGESRWQRALSLEESLDPDLHLFGVAMLVEYANTVV